MNKILDKALSMTADAALEAALASLGLASHAGSYQPKEPVELLMYSEERNSENE